LALAGPLACTLPLPAGAALPPVPDSGPSASRSATIIPMRRQRGLASAWVNVLLFAWTAAPVYVVGGPLLVVGLLSILLAHEMGHYVLCRVYRVDATLPY